MKVEIRSKVVILLCIVLAVFLPVSRMMMMTGETLLLLPVTPFLSFGRDE